MSKGTDQVRRERERGRGRGVDADDGNNARIGSFLFWPTRRFDGCCSRCSTWQSGLVPFLQRLP